MKDDKGEYIELNAFLKQKGLCATGGQAKILIRSGTVFVNDAEEHRNKRKLRKGDVVKVDNHNWKVQ